MSHTPPPWRVNLNFKYTDINYHQIIALDDFKKDGPGFSITGCINREDAQLIAAAPELLIALERAVEDIKTIEGKGLDFIVHEMELAINKAKGI